MEAVFLETGREESRMRKLFVSFSGGKSSGYMMKRLIDAYSSEYEMKFVFANTGQEHEETLAFVHACETAWNVPIAWVEAVVHHGARKGTTHKVVTYESASRDGHPFEETIRKYGIPNLLYPHCTRELKLRPMVSYLASQGWKTGDYWTAIGIRNDELKRVRKDAAAAKILYPMVSLFPSDKIDVNDWWDDQPFNLDLKPHQGNCSWCWKKSLTKHFHLIDESPQIFDFPRRMEREYGLVGPRASGEPYRVFFRGERSVDDLFAYRKNVSVLPPVSRDEDGDAGCSESCEVNMEIGADEENRPWLESVGLGS